MEDENQAARFAELERDIRRINIDGETIELTYHLRQFAELFQRYIVDDRTLSDLFSYLNRAALADGKFAVNMATVFASRQLDDLVIKETKLRNAMLTILQQNFQSIDSLKHEGLGRFYNSITLLGEYYHKKKFANGKRILILGQSLLLLLTTELESEIKKCEELEGHTIDPEFAKVILTQVTLNGGEAKTEHKQEIDDLNYSIRKCLINVEGMSSRAKAYLLMSLDLFYTNFNLGQKLLEKLYGKYLFEPDEDTSAKPDGKSSEGSSTTAKEAESSGAGNSKSNSTGSGGSGAKTASKKPAEKTDHSRKQRNSKPAPAKPRRKEEPASPAATSRPTPSTPPKKTPPTRVRPAPNQTSPRKDQHQQRNTTRTAATTTTTSPKSPLQRRSPPEKIKHSGPTSPPLPNPSVLKQNCKVTTKNHNHSTTSPNTSSNTSNSPGNGHGGGGGHNNQGGGGANPLKLQMPLSGTGTGLGRNHEDNVENLAWDDLTLEDESPQKINPHTKSFLSFLAQK